MYNELIGGSIHRFHSDPKKIERLLNNANALPHQTTFSFGAVGSWRLGSTRSLGLTRRCLGMSWRGRT